MIPLADWDLSQGDNKRRIELYWGDLSFLPPEHAVDILVVSAFRNDYFPTPTSLIGALKRNGVSVYDLSFNKSHDMREEFSCWLTHPVGVSSFKRILCVESGWNGSPPEIADDLFRALAPTTLINVPTKTVAMPLIGAGDQGYGAGEILEAVLLAAVDWFRRGLRVQELKIVAYSPEAAEEAKARFLKIKEVDAKRQDQKANKKKVDNDWDVFLSYSSNDSAAADRIEQALTASRSGIRLFRDRSSIAPGTSWLRTIAHAIDSTRCVLALYSPDFWDSDYCWDELQAAYVRQTTNKIRLLYPILYRDSSIPSFFGTRHFRDCREADMQKLADACSDLCQSLQNGH